MTSWGALQKRLGINFNFRCSLKSSQYNLGLYIEFLSFNLSRSILMALHLLKVNA